MMTSWETNESLLMGFQHLLIQNRNDEHQPFFPLFFFKPGNPNLVVNGLQLIALVNDLGYLS